MPRPYLLARNWVSFAMFRGSPERILGTRSQMPSVPASGPLQGLLHWPSPLSQDRRETVGLRAPQRFHWATTSLDRPSFIWRSAPVLPRGTSKTT